MDKEADPGLGAGGGGGGGGAGFADFISNFLNIP